MASNSLPPSTEVGDHIEMADIIPSGTNEKQEPPSLETGPSNITGDSTTEQKASETEQNAEASARPTPPVEEKVPGPWDIDLNQGNKKPTSAPKTVDDGIKILSEILEALQDSSTAGPTAAKDDRSRFWAKYKRVSEEFDTEFLERYTSDMDIVLIFAGLFSAVSTSFIIAMEPSLVPDPNETTNTLLFQISQILANSTASGGVSIMAPPVFSGPSPMDVWVQSITYLSLASSLLAAFGAVLGKQWLSYYKSQRYGRGSLAERGIRRQEKLDGFKTWYFEAILQSFPLLIQCSLVLFGLALSGHMWSEQQTIAGVIIATTSTGVLFYLYTLFASLQSPACPFQSPLSTICRLVRPYIAGDATLEKMSKLLKLIATKLGTIMALANPGLLLFSKLWAQVQKGSVTMLQVASQLLKWLRSRQRSIANSTLMHHFLSIFAHLHPVQDIERGSPNDNPEMPRSGDIIQLNIPVNPSKSIDVPALLWLLETSTDPDVLLAASQMVPRVDWSLEIDISGGFIQLTKMVTRSLGSDNLSSPGEDSNTLTLSNAVHHLSLNIGKAEAIKNLRSSGLQDSWQDTVWKEIHLAHKSGHVYECVPRYYDLTSFSTPVLYTDQPLAKDFVSTAAEVDILQVLHRLPYMDFRDYGNESIEYLAIGSIRRILEGKNDLKPQSPGVSDCPMLLAWLLGFKFNAKDIQKVDKSPAFDTLVCTVFKEIGAVLQSHNHDQSKSLKKRALDCLGFMPSLLPLLSYDMYVKHVTADAWLSICKELFDPEAAANSRTWDHLPQLQTSIQQTIHSILPSESQLGFTPDQDLLQKHLLWQLEFQLTSEPISGDHPWLLKHLQYLCSDTIFPATNTTYVKNVLLIHAYVPVEDIAIQSYLNILMFCMDDNKPNELRHAAVRAAYTKKDIVHSAGKWNEVLDNAYTFFGVIQPPKPGKENDYLYQQQMYSEWCCLYLWVKAFSAMAPAAEVDTTWNGRLKQSGHMAQIKESLTHPSMAQLQILFKTMHFIKIFLADQISADLDKNNWKSIITEFWNNIIIFPQYFFGELNNSTMWLDFTEFFPQIIQLTKIYAPSKDPVASILQGISKTKNQFHNDPDWYLNSPSLLPNLNDLEQQIGHLKVTTR